ncbi:MAG: DciA family protein [Corynebacterium sp.]|nr:DciA family protein [Corynebacterium sp.]
MMMPDSQRIPEATDAIAAAYERLQSHAQRLGIRIPRNQTVGNGVGLQEKMHNDARKSRYRRPTGRDGYALRRRKAPKPLSQVVQGNAKQHEWVQHIAVARLLNDWENVVGEQIAAHTVTLRFDKGVLYVECDSTSWATTLRNMQSPVIQHIASEIGDDVVTTLKCYGPRPPSWRHGKLHVKGRGPRDTYG